MSIYIFKPSEVSGGGGETIIQGIQYGWEKYKEIQVASDVDSIAFTDLDINTDLFYHLMAVIKNPTGSYTHYRIFVEGDVTASNYYHQYLAVDSTSVATNRANNPTCICAGAGDRSFASIYISKDPDGYFRFFSTSNEWGGSGQGLVLRSGSRAGTASNITQISIVSDTAGGIGAGSKFVLFRYKRT